MESPILTASQTVETRSYSLARLEILNLLKLSEDEWLLESVKLQTHGLLIFVSKTKNKPNADESA